MCAPGYKLQLCGLMTVWGWFAVQMFDICEYYYWSMDAGVALQWPQVGDFIDGAKYVLHSELGTTWLNK